MAYWCRLFLKEECDGCGRCMRRLFCHGRKAARAQMKTMGSMMTMDVRGDEA